MRPSCWKDNEFQENAQVRIDNRRNRHDCGECESGGNAMELGLASSCSWANGIWRGAGSVCARVLAGCCHNCCPCTMRERSGSNPYSDSSALANCRLHCGSRNIFLGWRFLVDELPCNQETPNRFIHARLALAGTGQTRHHYGNDQLGHRPACLAGNGFRILPGLQHSPFRGICSNWKLGVLSGTFGVPGRADHHRMWSLAIGNDLYLRIAGRARGCFSHTI